MEIQDYTDSEFKHALARNLRSLTRGKKSSKQPIAILLGGQSGAGKTTIHRIKQKEFQGNIVIIDGDSFRSQHPHYLELTIQGVEIYNLKSGMKLQSSFIML
ncbi:zeta toxin [Streptococcus pneumoniae]|nr:zeta toxin [Streptococcus pneumoniae]